MDKKMDKDFNDTPLSLSNVSLRLADIQKRCSQLLDESDDFGGLSLEEPVAAAPIDKKANEHNPYDQG